MDEKLKPCPYCATPAEIKNVMGKYIITCWNKHDFVGTSDRDGTIDEYNTRRLYDD